MATNNNLQSIRLGAPTSIEVENQYPHAALTVQTMERCDTLTLHDAADGTRCTDEGAMVTAARLFSQLMHERSISENAEGWSITFNVYAMVDAAVYGGADHPVPMSLSGADGAAVCWAVEGDATPGVSLTADGVLTLPAGCTDTLRIKAIRWDDREVRAMTTIPVSGWREVADLLVQYPQLAAVLAQYPQLAVVLAERPSLAAVVAEWPSVVNSLVETGKYPTMSMTDANTYFMTNIIPNNTTEVEVSFKYSGGYWGGILGVRNGTGATATNFFIAATSATAIQCNAGTGRAGTVSVASTVNDFNTIKMSGSSLYVNGNLVSSYSGNVACTTAMRIYGNGSTDNKANVTIAKLVIKHEGITHEYLPYNKNDVYGFIDISDNTFYPSANTPFVYNLLNK